MARRRCLVDPLSGSFRFELAIENRLEPIFADCWVFLNQNTDNRISRQEPLQKIRIKSAER